MGNVGAELRLQIIVDDIKKANPNADITICCFRYNLHSKIKGVHYLFLHNVFTAVLETVLRIPKFDYIICGEGIPFVDFCGSGFINYFLPVLNFAHILGKKTACYSFDIDHLSESHKKRVINILKDVDMLVTRTKKTYDFLKKHGFSKNLHLGTDTSLLFKTKERNTNDYRIGFCLKDFYCYPIKFRLLGKKENCYHYPYYYTYKNHGKRKYEKFISKIARVIDNLLEENKKLKINFIVMEDQMDYKTSRDIYDLLENRERVEIISRKNHNINEIVSSFSKLKCLIAARYHAVILGVRHKIPTLVLSTDERFDYFIQELGLDRFLIDIYKEEISMKEITDFIRENHKNRKIFSERISKKLPILEKRARENYKFLKSFFMAGFLE